MYINALNPNMKIIQLENRIDDNEEQRKRFHQNIIETENWYQGNWNVNMRANF